MRHAYLVKNASSSSMLSDESTNSGWLIRPTTIITRWELCAKTTSSNEELQSVRTHMLVNNI
jgi:hypothetical protein